MKVRWDIIKYFFYQNRYLIVIVLSVINIGFVGESNLRKRFEYGLRTSELQEQIDKYKARNEHDSKYLRDLKRDPKTIERIARERYFMKTDDEDIFVLSDDESEMEQSAAISGQVSNPF
ncbi:MAG: septum formation initiator family protein [Prevotella sp.]|nr:septum formation initiator family protein [Prevotella sp.]MDY3851716.1 septum formation initiator family protein [Prevotella sp.]